MRVLAVGPNSFLSRAFATSSHHAVTVLSFREAMASPFGAYDAVVNFAYCADYMQRPYNEGFDLDLAVARRAAAAGVRFFLLSSRRVYGPGEGQAFVESAPLRPVDTYGTNKATTEAAVMSIPGSQSCVLRLSNVFGFEPGRHTFLGAALTSLKRDNAITLDISPFTSRDFLPAAGFAKALEALLSLAPDGVYNVGSGRGSAVGKVGLAIISGFGQGRLVITSPEERDAFWLDTARLKAVIGPSFAEFDVEGECRAIGERLRIV